MNNILETIVEHRRQAIALLKQQLPLATITASLSQSKRSLAAALSEAKTSFILECKKASPSKGLIRENFDLAEIVDAYSPVATAISVLTEPKYFAGDFEDLRFVSDNVSQPVLNKDFIFDSYQVYLARYYKADAILLMLSVLSDQQYRELADVAASLGLDVLTEVSNEDEVHRANALNAKIIGINNRNLRDLTTDLATTERLRPLIDKDRLVISESGISSHQDVRRLCSISHGFLVGSSIMAEDNLTRAIGKLVYGSVKVCGITTIEDAHLVSQSGAQFAGLIFAENSKRKVTPTQGLAICQAQPFQYVGVFANQPAQHVADIAKQLTLVAVQLHGCEDQHYRQTLRQILPAQCEIWQAVGVQNQLPALPVDCIDQTLLDCQVGTQSGGTGSTFDWQLLSGVSNRQQLGIAGGLNAENIAAASQLAMAFMDVNSGVETSPGQKSKAKINKLFGNLRCY